MCVPHRPLLPLFLALTLALAACGASTADRAPEQRTRAVRDARGTVRVPVDPRRVLVLDEHSAMGMLSVGRRPALVYGTLSSAASQTILREAGVRVREEPTFLTEPDLEQVARDEPDLIVLSEAGPLLQVRDRLERIAPVVSLGYGDGWEAALRQAGEIFDARAAARETAAAIRSRVAGSRDTRAAGTSLAIVFGYNRALNYPAPDAPMSRLVGQAGFRRPAPERSSTGELPGQFIVPFSEETLSRHDADRMAILSQTYYDAEAVRDSPAFERMTVGRGGRATDVDGEMWWGNSPFTAWWVLDDLDALMRGEPAGTTADATTRWAAFEAAAGR